MFTLIILCGCVSYISTSAIPMWELLGKEEKLSYLYSMFAYQVEEFCEFSINVNCNQDLLKHGLTKLKSLNDDQLDAMDPYQRGASDIIWNSIIEGQVMKKPKLQTTTTTAKPNSYEDDLSFSNDDLGSQGLASAKIDNVYRVPPPPGFVYVQPQESQYIIKTGTPEYRQPLNQLPFEDILQSTVLNDDLDNNNENTHLTGPMVVRVHLDGTPVDEGSYEIPQDEDLKQYKLSQLRLPLF